MECHVRVLGVARDFWKHSFLGGGLKYFLLPGEMIQFD